MIVCFFFNDTATTEIYTLSLHDALPILLTFDPDGKIVTANKAVSRILGVRQEDILARSEEHTSELQSLRHLVCRLLLEKKNKIIMALQSWSHTIRVSGIDVEGHTVTLSV